MRVLLLDAAFSAVPIHRALEKAGHEVWVMGSRPADILARRAGERWINQDYSQVAEVARHVQRLGMEAVVPGCTDVSMDTAVALGCKGSRLDSAEVNALLSNKAAFRRLCLELDLPAPRVVDKSSFPREGQFICKPVDAFSGRGITTFDGGNATALSDAWEVATSSSRSGEAIIEQFARGPLHSCSAFIASKRVVQSFYVIEGSSANPYAVDTSHVVRDVPEACRARLEQAIDTLAGHLDLSDGLLHVQFILDGQTPYIVELARRCPGDLYAMLIEYSTGIAYAEAYAAFLLGERVSFPAPEYRHVLRHTVTSLRNDIYEGLQFHSPQPVRAFYPIQHMGQDMLSRQQSRSGVLFTEYDNERALRQAYEAFLGRQAYDVSW